MSGSGRGLGRGPRGMRWHRACRVLCAGSVGFASLAGAQNAPSPDTARVTRAAALSTVVTTATRDARTLAAVPGAMSVTDSAALRRTRGAALGEALRLVPGVQVNSLYGSEDVRVSIRGAGSRGGFGVRGIALLLDGVPLTEPDGQGRLDLPELVTARQLEIVRGASSALYGGAAGGGALNIVTATGRDAPGLGARMVFGDPGLRKTDLSWGGARGAWDLLLHGGATSNDGYRAWSRGNVRRATLRAGVATLGGRIALDASAADVSQRIPGALTLVERDAAPQTPEPVNLQNRFTRDERRWRVGVRADLPVRGRLDAWLVASGRDNEQAIFQFIRQIQQRWQAGARHTSSGLTGGTAWRFTLGADADRAAGPQTNWVNRGGLPLVTTPCVNDALVGTFVPCVRQDAALRATSASAQAELTRGRWAVVAGTRFDDVRFDIANRIRPAQSVDRRFAQVSPKLAVSFRPSATSTWWSSLARGFEVPTAVELATSPDTLRGFNDALGPASQWQAEVGWRGVVGPRVAGEVVAFAADVRDDFVSRTVVIPGVPQPRAYFENAARTRRAGLEAAVHAAWSAQWRTSVAASWSSFTFVNFDSPITGADFRPTTLDASDRQLPGIPQLRGTVQVDWHVRPAVAVTLWQEWSSRVFVDNGNTGSGTVFNRTGPLVSLPAVPAGTRVPFASVPPLALTHLALSWRLGDATVHGMVDNVWGARWVSAIAPNATNGRFYLPGAGRTVTLGLSVGALRP
jgi:iron complex outermembrane recepter protein